MFAATVHVGAQRADDLQEIVLEILPFQIHFLQRDVPFVPYREQQVGQCVDETARGHLRRNFAVKHLRHLVQAGREILDYVGHSLSDCPIVRSVGRPTAGFVLRDQLLNIQFDVFFQFFIQETLLILFVVEQYLAHVAQRVVVIAQSFSTTLPLGSRSDPFDGHVPQPFANGVQKDQHHVVQQRMALHEKIDIVGFDAELPDMAPESGHFADPGRMVGFQRSETLFDLTAEPVQRFGARRRANRGS